jgi:hypothetical protein
MSHGNGAIPAGPEWTGSRRPVLSEKAEGGQDTADSAHDAVHGASDDAYDRIEEAANDGKTYDSCSFILPALASKMRRVVHASMPV